MANIFFEKMGKDAIHKEFLQEEVTVENLLNEYHQMNQEKFFNDSKLYVNIYNTAVQKWLLD